jgi:hypothetical protein
MPLEFKKVAIIAWLQFQEKVRNSKGKSIQSYAVSDQWNFQFSSPKIYKFRKTQTANLPLEENDIGQREIFGEKISQNPCGVTATYLVRR